MFQFYWVSISSTDTQPYSEPITHFIGTSKKLRLEIQTQDCTQTHEWKWNSWQMLHKSSSSMSTVVVIVVNTEWHAALQLILLTHTLFLILLLLPQQCEDKWGHLCALADFAIALNESIQEINKHSFNNFELRIGTSFLLLLLLFLSSTTFSCYSFFHFVSVPPTAGNIFSVFKTLLFLNIMMNGGCFIDGCN